MEGQQKNAAVWGRNIIGFVLGAVLGYAAYFVTGVLFGFLLSVRWLAALLSWPSTPLLYALFGMGLAGVGVGTLIAGKVCLPSSKGVKTGCLVLGGLIILYFGLCAVSSLLSHGLSDYVWGYGATALMGLLPIEEAKSKKRHRKMAVTRR